MSTDTSETTNTSATTETTNTTEPAANSKSAGARDTRSEEHTSELQSQ